LDVKNYLDNSENINEKLLGFELSGHIIHLADDLLAK